MAQGISAGRRRPQLHLITDPRLSRPALLDAVARAVTAGVDVVQVREKSAPARELLSLVLAVRDRIRGRALLIVNDRIDVALAANIDGVHLAAKSLSPDIARRLLGPHRHVGISVHSHDEAVQAERAGADSVTFGHIFATPSHPGIPPRGLELLRNLVEFVTVPVIAIGGIGPDHVRRVMAVGASGIAVISTILEASDPAEAATALRTALDTPLITLATGGATRGE